jgi:hypothetical protein
MLGTVRLARSSASWFWRAGVGALVLVLAFLGAASGTTPTTGISVTARQVGNTEKLTGAPSMIKGGVVAFTLVNRTSGTPGLQLLRILGNHSAAEAMTVYTNPNSKTTPDWLLAEGGVGSVGPGMAKTAIVKLAPGRYVGFDYNTPSSSPPNIQFTVTSRKPGSLPATSGHVTAHEVGKDRYAWNLAGLKPGVNRVTFTSQGKTAIHLILAVPIGHHSLAEVKRALVGTLIDGKPPPAFLDLAHSTDAPSLDGGSQDIAQLNLQRGTYAFVCPLTDRDGGKPHFLEGLLKEVTIK